jgi:hypothetical protein
MSWFQSTADLTCGGCGLRFARGTPLRQFTAGPIRCAACAKKLLGEDPPDLTQLPLPAPRPAPPPLQAFEDPRRLVEAFRLALGPRLVVDRKQRAGGER